MPALGLLLAFAAPHIVAAQSVTLRLGGFRTFYADTLDVTAGSAAADVTWSSARSRLALSGSLATFESDGWAAQGAAAWSGALITAGARGLFATSDLSGYGFDDGTWAGTGGAGIIGALPLGPILGSAAVTVGGVRRLDGTDDVMSQAFARLRHERGPITLDAWGAATRAGSQAYGDLAAAGRVEWSAFALDLTGGARFGDLGDIGWGQVRAAARVVGPAWIEVSGGRYPPDVTGFAQGTFVQVGLRASLGRLPSQPKLAAGPAVAIEHETDGTILLTFLVRGREPAHVVGAWSGWSPQPLERVGRDRWQARVVIAPGLHRFTLLDRNGGPFVPEGIPSEPDEFGTTTGLLVVPPR